MRPWKPFLAYLIELDRRRSTGLLQASALEWLEAEALMILEDERARIRRRNG